MGKVWLWDRRSLWKPSPGLCSLSGVRHLMPEPVSVSIFWTAGHAPCSGASGQVAQVKGGDALVESKCSCFLFLLQTSDTPGFWSSQHQAVFSIF